MGLVRSNVVRSLGWDPRHHEEIRNGPENKIHIWKVKIRVSEKFRFFSGELLECSRSFRSGPHMHGGVHAAKIRWTHALTCPIRKGRDLNGKRYIYLI